MKFLSLAVVSSILFSNLAAANVSASFNATSNSDFGAVILTTSAPVVSIKSLIDCARNGGAGDEGIECTFGLTTFGPISTSTLMAVVLLKEDVQQVEPDAYAFLAGEEMTLALQELVNKIRNENTEVNNRSDLDIVNLMLESLEIK